MATTTPNYGWDVPTSTDYVADGAVAIETLGDDIDATLYTALGGNYPGLRLIKTQTIGTTVSSVVVNDAFSATYGNYKIVVSGGAASTDASLNLSIGNANTAYEFFAFSGSSANSAYSGSAGTNEASFPNACRTSSSGLNGSIDVFSPFLTTRTNVQIISLRPNTVTGGMLFGSLKNDISYTSFTLTASSGTITGGTIHVYGYGAN